MALVRFQIEQSSEAVLTSHSGMALVGLLLERYAHLDRHVSDHLPHCRGIAHADIIRTYLGLLCQGKNDFEAVRALQGDTFFEQALGLRQLPSEPTLRQRLDEHATAFTAALDRANVDLLATAGVPLSPLVTGHIALDIDGSPFDNSGTKKEGVSRTYKGFDGYGAMMAYLGEEGYCVGAELHVGSDHGQKDFGYFLERVLPRVRRLAGERPVLARLDSGHDAAENRIAFKEAGVDFLIKWNPRKHPIEREIAYVGEQAIPWQEKRPGKREALYSVMTEQRIKGKDYRWRRVVRLTEETASRSGQQLLLPLYTMEGWWTSLGEDEESIIRLYEQHGTSEQFHSEFKTDLDLERFPSGKFDTNEFVLTAGAMAYNVLRIIGQMTLASPMNGMKDLMPVRHRAKRRRLKTVLQDLVYLASRLVRSGRQLKLRFGRHCPGLEAFKNLYDRLGSGHPWAPPLRC